jgi:hypothetical protein
MENRNKSLERGFVETTLLEESGEKSNEIRRAVEVLFEPGAVVEVRAFKGRETVSGYYDDHVSLANEAGKVEDWGYSVYVTLNEVVPALLARTSNRVRKVYKEPTTSDNDIVRRRWFPLDFDPVRPSAYQLRTTRRRPPSGAP